MIATSFAAGLMIYSLAPTTLRSLANHFVHGDKKATACRGSVRKQTDPHPKMLAHETLAGMG